jgi:hypothetical protein
MTWADELDRMAAREAEALAGRRWEELAGIQDERHALLESLPRPLPAAARPVLERALAVSISTQQALQASMAETKGAIERLRGGRRAIGAYGMGRSSSLDRLA